MPRAVWKGAVTFGLVHVPVALYPASQSDDIDFDWLDKRSMDPVGYLRVNKRTGKEIAKEDIVKGVKQADGDYVIISEEEINEAYPKTAQSIEIQAFVKAQEVSFIYLERPYYLEAIGKGDKVYALLRDAMVKAGVIGIARVVMHTKEHLAALVPAGPALMLDLLRWSSEIRPLDELNIPGKDASAAIKAAELTMATQLIDEMTMAWKPEDYADTFKDAVEDLIARKVKAGKTHRVEPIESPIEGGTASNVVDLTALLRNSLGRRAGSPANVAPPAPAKAARASTTTKTSAASTTTTKAAKAQPKKPAARQRA